MTTKEMDLVRKFRELLEVRLHLHSLVVFGSRARGDAQEDSDLDVLVVIEEEETFELRMFVYDCAWEAGFGSGIIICPLLFSQDRWENSPEQAGTLAWAIEHEGVAV